MKIGTHNAKDYGAKQLTVEFQLPQTGSSYEWPDGFSEPIDLPTTQKCGSVKAVILFKGRSRNEIMRNISDFCGLFDGPQKVELDGYQGWYLGRLQKSTVAKTVNGTAYKLTIELDGYMVGEEEAVEATQGLPITRKGSRRRPCTVEITTPEDAQLVTLRGFAKEIAVKNLTAGVTVTISADGLVLENGNNKMQDVEMKAFPILEEETTLTWEPAAAAVVVRYIPAWM